MDAEVQKYGIVVPVSDALMRDNDFSLEDALRLNATMTPEERAENVRRRAAERAAVRSSTTVRFTAAAVEDRMGWKRGYLEHLAQPYCDCYDGYDGWDFCEHARDLGLVAGQ